MQVSGKTLPLIRCGKWLCLVLAAAFLVAISMGSRSSTADFSTVSQAVTAAADLTDTLEGDSQMIRRLYGLDPGDFDGAMLYYPATNMGSRELLLIKLRDRSQEETVRAAMEKRLTTQQDAFEGYAPEQYAMVKSGVVEIRGGYALLISCGDPEAVRQALLDAL